MGKILKRIGTTISGLIAGCLVGMFIGLILSICLTILSGGDFIVLTKFGDVLLPWSARMFTIIGGVVGWLFMDMI